MSGTNSSEPVAGPPPNVAARQRSEPPGGAPAPRAERSVPPRVPKARPDARPMRIAFAVTGIAAASAMATAIVTPHGAVLAGSGAVVVADVLQPSPAPSHITRYVRLAPGQTPPPQATVQQLPPPSPRVVVVTTRQSGMP